MNKFVGMEYGHWGITVFVRNHERDYAPASTEFFGYPVSCQGPVDSAETERQAMARCRELGGTPKGPFFSQRAA